MADVAVENPANNIAFHKPAPLDTIPNIDSLEGTGSDGGDEYATLKRLQRHLEYVVSRRGILPYKPSLVANTDCTSTGTFNSRRNTLRMSRGNSSFFFFFFNLLPQA